MKQRAQVSTRDGGGAGTRSRSRQASVHAAIFAAALLLLSRPGSDEPQTKEIVLVDDSGQVRAVLGAPPADWPGGDQADVSPFGLFLYAPDGKPRVSLTANSSSGVLETRDSALRTRLKVGSNESSAAVLILTDEGKPCITLSRTGQNSGLAIADQTGRVRAQLARGAGPSELILLGDGGTTITLRTSSAESELTLSSPSTVKGIALTCAEESSIFARAEPGGGHSWIRATPLRSDIGAVAADKGTRIQAAVQGDSPARVFLSNGEGPVFAVSFPGWPFPIVSRLDADGRVLGRSRVLTEEVEEVPDDERF